jgi:hypothetical protein
VFGGIPGLVGVGVVRVRPYKRTPLKRTYKKWQPEKLLEAIRAECLKVLTRKYYHFVTAEALSEKFRDQKSLVTTALQKLIPEGIVGHKCRGYRHDNEWTPALYMLVSREDRQGVAED